MKIPESFRIGGVEYPVEYVDNFRLYYDMRFCSIDRQKCEMKISGDDTIFRKVQKWLQDNGRRFFDIEERR